MIYLEKRLEKLRATLAARGLEALVLVDAESLGWENMFYYSGFRGSSAVAVISHDRALLAVDGRYRTQAQQQSTFELRQVVTGTKEAQTVERLLKELGVRRCGYDGKMLSAAMFLSMSGLAEWADFSADMAEQRRHKDASEIALIAQAADIAMKAYLDTLPEVRVGMKEIEFAKLLELNIARHDGEGVWHKSSMIVASGVRSAMPHGRAGAKSFEYGDQVTVDYGAIFGAYMSDLTRNFSLGAPKYPEFLEIHEVLRKAHTDAVAQLRPGVRGCDVHAVAARVIADAGYGQYFTHGLGHSFGLEIHEEPRLSLAYFGTLEVGDIITVEPGIYIPERGGLRLEDDYLITETGAVRLSPRLPQEFVHLDV